ncbi:MAG TPA: Rieske 2Fe-2S domain-containing protein [Actinomycetota bacterium]|nr:Rieske 2Fe-2S domain-containing protein [Actinomycetota bacterium]
MGGLTRGIERMQSLDGGARLLQRALARIIPRQSLRKDLLSGTWMGRPLHPVLTDVVIGTWVSSAFLDLSPDERMGKAADRLLLVGNLSATPTIAAGLSDWADLWGEQQRLGSVHALGNAAALGLQVLSYQARRAGRRKVAKWWSVAALTAAGGSAYLGGHLSFVKGVGVNRTAFEVSPQQWTPVIKEDALAEGTLTAAQANDVRLVLYRKDDQVYAISDRCTHRGCSLHLGQVNDLKLECPCHGSIFRLTDGAVIRGPATVPAPVYDVRGNDGELEVRRLGIPQWGRPVAGPDR